MERETLDDLQNIHCYPLQDLREHIVDGSPCWCGPEIFDFPGGAMVTHNSMDQREEYEQGRAKH